MTYTGSLFIGRLIALLFLIVGIAVFVQRIYYIIRYDRVKATIVDVATYNNASQAVITYEYNGQLYENMHVHFWMFYYRIGMDINIRISLDYPGQPKDELLGMALLILGFSILLNYTLFVLVK